jgi:hypothetical protein
VWRVRFDLKFAKTERGEVQTHTIMLTERWKEKKDGLVDEFGTGGGGGGLKSNLF